MLFPLVYLGAKVASCFIGAKVRFSFGLASFCLIFFVAVDCEVELCRLCQVIKATTGHTFKVARSFC